MKVFILLALVACSVALPAINNQMVADLTDLANEAVKNNDLNLDPHFLEIVKAQINPEAMEELLKKHGDVLLPFVQKNAKPTEPKERCFLLLAALAAIFANALTTTTAAPAPGR